MTMPSARNVTRTTAAVTTAPSAASLALSELRRRRFARGIATVMRSPALPRRRHRDVEIHRARLAGGHVHVTHDGAGPLVPPDDGVVPFRHVVDHVSAVATRRCEVGIREHEHGGAHVLMNVTEHLDVPRTLERPGLRRAPGVASKVESLRPGRGR